MRKRTIKQYYIKDFLKTFLRDKNVEIVNDWQIIRKRGKGGNYYIDLVPPTERTHKGGLLD